MSPGPVPLGSWALDPLTDASLILLLMIVIAPAFDFTKGFHDTGNAMPTSIATDALRSPGDIASVEAHLNEHHGWRLDE